MIEDTFIEIDKHGSEKVTKEELSDASKVDEKNELENLVENVLVTIEAHKC